MIYRNSQSSSGTFTFYSQNKHLSNVTIVISVLSAHSVELRCETKPPANPQHWNSRQMSPGTQRLFGWFLAQMCGHRHASIITLWG